MVEQLPGSGLWWMTAALGPVEEMVSKERPAKWRLVLMAIWILLDGDPFFFFGSMFAMTYARMDSSLSAAWTSSNFVPFSTSSSSSHAKYSLSAAPSRIWQARIPSSSVLFLMALASPTGLRTSSTLSSPPSSRLRAHDALVEIMNLLFGSTDCFSATFVSSFCSTSGFKLSILMSSNTAS